MKFLFILIVMMALVIPVSASQSINQYGNGDSAIQVGDNAHIDVAHADVKQDITNNYGSGGSSSINVVLPESPPSTSYLGVGDADYTRVIFPGYIALIPVVQNETISVKSGTPVALYTISGKYKNDIMGEQSIPWYDPVWDRLNHGSVPFVDKIDHYTTKETIIVSSGANLLVIDNRNIFQSYNLVEVKSELTATDNDSGSVPHGISDLPEVWV